MLGFIGENSVIATVNGIEAGGYEIPEAREIVRINRHPIGSESDTQHSQRIRRMPSPLLKQLSPDVHSLTAVLVTNDRT